MVKRLDCLKLLASWMDENMFSVSSLSNNAREWPSVCRQGHHFHNLNMGMCLSFALGLSLAFPKRKVMALESDGSLLVDTSSLVTLADVNPANLIALVFDNQEYGKMGPTATSRRANLEGIAHSAGVEDTATIRTMEEFNSLVKGAIDSSGLKLFVIKVERGRAPVGDYLRTDGRAMKELFLQKLISHPDYWGNEKVVTVNPK
ncbi:MAG: hypothetical protein HY695_09185 [Deltaproteobacteria bacterium]|nr:hypothetical protein [Deltaproteobacteria bacterium]